ncbi:DUF4224 domain-containing protein [Paraburkholderia youngii]|uniref:DUF4224 domain-containing protein n=1 Tax=Paraburkholderia youngii TaxID=2782701 RepID=UPI003D19ADA5
MLSDYLTAHELADLIDCKPNQRTAMQRWLKDNRWKFVVDRNGLPKVSRTYRDMKLGVTPDDHTHPKFDAAPNLQAFS